MKKATFLAAAIALVGICSTEVNAQAATGQGQATEQAQQGEEGKKEKVTQDQLPEPVKTALESDTYKGWTIGEIYKVTPAAGDAQGLAIYEVTMTNAQEQSGTIRIDEKGAEAPKAEASKKQ